MFIGLKTISPHSTFLETTSLPAKISLAKLLLFEQNFELKNDDHDDVDAFFPYECMRWNSEQKKWIAICELRGKEFCLGHFDDIHQAAKVSTALFFLFNLVHFYNIFPQESNDTCFFQLLGTI